MRVSFSLSHFPSLPSLSLSHTIVFFSFALFVFSSRTGWPDSMVTNVGIESWLVRSVNKDVVDILLDELVDSRLKGSRRFDPHAVLVHERDP